jgi:hypothetical protein
MKSLTEYLFFVVDGIVILLGMFALAIGLPLFSAWAGLPDSIGLFLMGAVVFCGTGLFFYRLIESGESD